VAAKIGKRGEKRGRGVREKRGIEKA